MPSRFGVRGHIKNHATAILGELVGTTMFLFIAEGAAKTAKLGRTASQTDGVAAPLDNSTVMMIATSFGLSLLFTAWLFYRISGGLFNPAITVALYGAGVLTGLRAILLFITQIVGGIIASALVLALTPSGTGDVDAVNTSLSDQTTYAQGFFLELLTTSILVFSVLMLAVEKHRATYLAPVGIGLTLFACHLFTAPWTGSGMNPARSFGPAVVGAKFPPHHEIYWVAPLLGGLLALTYFEILKAFKYSSALLDQDSDKETNDLRPIHLRIYHFFGGKRDRAQEKLVEAAYNKDNGNSTLGHDQA